MKRLFSIIISSFLILNLFFVEAGLMVTKGVVNLKPLETKELKDAVCVFSTYKRPITCKVEVSDNLKKFFVQEKSFTLTGNILNCSQDPEERRRCIADLCSFEGKNARIVVIKFKGPFSFTFSPSFDFYPKKETYKGSIKAICRIGAATTVEPIDFWVNFYPLNLFPFIIILIIIIFVFLFFFFKRKKRT